MSSRELFSCIILAGGEGKRVGGVDKGLLDYKDRPLIEHVIEKVASQVDDIVISANRNTESYKRYAQTVISDDSDHYLGPLAGISAALPHCIHDRVLLVACDIPFLPTDLIDKFLSHRRDGNLYIAESSNKLQLAMLLHKSLHESIKQSLAQGQLRLMQWARSQHPQIINFDNDAVFKNFNYKGDFDT